MNILKKIKNSIVDIFFEKNNLLVMEDVFDPKDLTRHYAKEINEIYIDRILVATKYQKICNKIESYKYRSHRQHAPFFGEILSKLLSKFPEINTKNSIIIPVPMHWSRYWIRWFDHIRAVVEVVSKLQSKKVYFPLKAKISKRQSQLSKIQRRKNRENAYILKKKVNLPREIILVDDIISTGSTINSCAKILKEAWVEKVYWIFLASNQSS